MESQYLTFTEGGFGPPLVLLHAFPLTRKMWDGEIETWSKTHRVIAADWRGLGESPLATHQLSMESCADDLHQLLEHLGIKQKVILLGLSMGGYVAFEFVRKYPESLEGLVLAATQPIADSEMAQKGRYETAEFVQKKGAAALADRLIPRLLGRTTLQKEPATVQRVRGLIESNSPAGIAAACYGLASRRDSSAVLSQIRLPTLVVAGEEDVLIERIQAETMHQRITSSRMAVISESGHLVNLEQPVQFHQVVTDFLSDF
jgi:3-oxoadipate enol-lactonase